MSADEHLIDRARRLAEERRTSLNSMFREWLEQITALQEFLNVALKKFARPLSEFEAQEIPSDRASAPLLQVHSATALYSEALTLSHRYRLSWCDSLAVAAAVQAQCRTLWSEDLPDGLRIGDLQIRHPF